MAGASRPDPARCRRSLAEGLAALGLPVDPAVQDALIRFVERLDHWNRTYNLTAVRGPEAMVARHLLDSLSIAPWLQGPRVLDVGSGAGLPGIPLALTHPGLHFSLLDSNGKRIRFMTQMAAELAPDNLQIVQARVQDYRPARPFACVLARAFAPLERLLALAGRHCAADGRVLAMKGPEAVTELSRLPSGWQLHGCHRLAVPGLDAERWLLHLTPANA
ncbi:MAG: 16S rRNA (guanine(527)-N(7))-methyltransferase RsmG [Candidatus Competibacterales bacterium]|nr:16S rRNA (guanine(527)-N(7))-methyltransferase RsmG [Candidatus Competibacterales bacterium]